MKIKVLNQMFDSNNEPIMIIFDEGEKDLIGNMDGKDLEFCSFPEYSNIQMIEMFMADEVDSNQLDMFHEFNIPLVVGD